MSQQQKPLFEAESNWFHIFRSMIESGDVARMGATAFLIYTVIKAYTNFKTGVSFPSIETIAKKAGVSTDTVSRNFKILEEYGYITKEKQGRKNLYKLREKIDVTDNEGRPVAVASFDYIPDLVRTASAELKRFVCEGGDGKDFKIIHIENLVMNIGIVNAPGAINKGDQTGIGVAADPQLAQLFERIEKKRKKSVE